MSFHPQSQSPLFSKFPREIREKIYLELWRYCGQRQHILWHMPEGSKSHFCRWKCTIEYSFQDHLQLELDEMRRKGNIPPGKVIRTRTHPCRLLSPWLNHWACGERAETIYGEEAITGVTTSGEGCWKENKPGADVAPYFPMLLSCKLLSSECLGSIYSSTTFIFTDLLSFQMFVGYCKPPGRPSDWPEPLPPPSVKYINRLELSMTPIFPLDIPCCSPLEPGRSDLHDAYDFHWMKLDKLERLSSLKIWVASRSTMPRLPDQGEIRYDQMCSMMTGLDTNALGDVVKTFDRLSQFCLSTPLNESIGPEDEFVKDISQPGKQVWNRGTGDLYHPYPSNAPLFFRATIRGLVLVGHKREIKLA